MANAIVCLNTIRAVSIVLARFPGTPVDVILTVRAIETEFAFTPVPTDLVVTCPIISAWIAGTLVDIPRAVSPGKSCCTGATVTSNQVDA